MDEVEVEAERRIVVLMVVSIDSGGEPRAVGVARSSIYALTPDFSRIDYGGTEYDCLCAPSAKASRAVPGASGSVQSSPIQSSPIQSSPVQSSPVQSSFILAFFGAVFFKQGLESAFYRVFTEERVRDSVRA
ncbi:uncharacterized protein L3040_006583 [Drepanopeziza brunnea f. sp. 'multigermtubi']|uniref:uncharacterized protein n=1 Tax=Drepanopeziza brunnea f. sp. 'multigermtubi' TaxID=698441 RepID=UPI00239AD605|nr:hypothetical protein L3040_006583 [Drepanopeziza brunnea f. sp. 'multigermtubi']